MKIIHIVKFINNTLKSYALLIGTHLVFCMVSEPNTQKWFKSIHIFQESFAKNFN